MKISPQIVASCGLAVALSLVIVADTYAQGARAGNPLRIAPAKSKQVAAKTASSDAASPDSISTAIRTQSVTSDPSVRQASYGFTTSQHRHGSYTSARSGRETSIIRQEVIELPPDATTTTEVLPTEAEVMFDHAAGEYGGGKMYAGGCDSCGEVGCMHCCVLPCLSLDSFEFFAGVQGFSTPINRGGTGSFGFHEGFNWGVPVPCTSGCLGMQIGLRATQSNFSGAGFPQSATSSLYTDSVRNQIFVTGGLFRRVDWGLQGGLSIDYLRDTWYVNPDLVQLRGEISWVYPCAHELGFWFTASTQEDEKTATFTGSTTIITETYRSTDLYAFFYRHRWDSVPGAQCRVFAGWSGEKDGLIGTDFQLPIHDDFAIQAGFNYLIPEQATTGAAGGAHEEESWNVAMSLVWYPGLRSAYGNDYFRPLLNVADNGSFKVDRF